MSTTLGVGVRVWVGWCPDDAIDALFDGRCKTGTIIAGPWKDGDLVIESYTARRKIVSGTRWNVNLDDGSAVNADESMLYPINDGEQEDREVEGETEEPCHV